MFRRLSEILKAPDAPLDAGGSADVAASTPAAAAPVSAPPAPAAPADQAAAEPDDDDAQLVADELAPAPADPAPAPTEAPPAAPPAPPSAAAPAAVPPTGGTPDPLAKLQQDYQALAATLAELRAAKPGTPPATPQQEQAVIDAAAEIAELEKILAPDYEVDVAETPKAIAKQAAKALKALGAKLATIETERAQERIQVAETLRKQAASSEEQAFLTLEAQVHAKAPAADVKQEWKNALETAKGEGWATVSTEALKKRASDLFYGRIDALTAAPATPPPPAAAPPAPKPTAPAQRQITPHGAQVRVPNTGGNPRPPTAPSFDEDEIDERHTLVK